MSLNRKLGSLSGQRALIVEDDMIMGMDLESILREAGFQVEGIASTLEAAEVFFRSGRIDFAVLDINLNGMSVFPLARLLRDQNIPFFFLTGYSRDHIIPQEFKNISCFEKPIPDSSFLRAVVHLLEKNAA